MAGEEGLTLRFLGEMTIERDGLTLALPPSKKTRALLAYLAITGRTHRRERLCSMFWEIPDDPRGSLRWSLSKLRGLVDMPDHIRIRADRESVKLDTTDLTVDLLTARERTAQGLATLGTKELTELADLFRGRFLEGLDLSASHNAQAWIVAEREAAERLHARILTELIGRLCETPETALPYARELVQIDPHETAARICLIRLLVETGRRDEAQLHYETICRLHHEGSTADFDAPEQARLALISGIAHTEEATVAPPEHSTALPSDTFESKDRLPLPANPSIAVLPFTNLSDERDQEYFADGIAEDIIAALSRIRWLFVIARSSCFAYKGQPVGVRQVSAELGVHYVLDGSVRRAGDRIRVTAQLIDATAGVQIWSERYDRVLADLFAVQDEITEAIVAAIEPELGKAEQRRASQRRSSSLGAWDLCQRGMWHLYRRTKEDLAEARRLFNAALAEQPSMTQAHAGLVDAYYYEVVLGLATVPEENREQALAAARTAVASDPDDAAAHCAMGKARIMRREHVAATPALEQAITFNPNMAWAHYGLGAAAVFTGRCADAIPHLERAIRLSPRDLHMGSFMVRLTDAYLALRDYPRAIDWAERSLRQPCFQWSRYAVLISALGHLSRIEEAKAVLAELTPLRPDFSIAMVRATHLYTDQATFEHYLEGLRKAGVREEVV